MMNKGSADLRRYIPLACWIAVLLTTLFICLKIISYGYLPEGDARRHAAKPFANKPYSQILLLRPEYVVDHSPGSEWLLGVLHRELGWGEDGLISFSIASLLIWFFCLPLYLSATSDLDRRYSHFLDENFVDASDPKLQGWLPEKDGIFYADNMQFFYDTFYKNPQAGWCYIVGFEPALMPPDDLKIYRAIHRLNGADEAYEPWIKKCARKTVWWSAAPSNRT
jgi:hypothetical protein